MKQFIRMLLGRAGYSLVRRLPADPFANFPDLSDTDRATIIRVQPFTMTSTERLVSVISATKYIVQNNIPGDIVECGVWRGGSIMAAALTLQSLGENSRRLYLYDTFEGMSAPTEHDRSLDGQPAAKLLEDEPPGTGIWCYAGLEDVRRNLAATGYPHENIIYVKGKVEDTIPQTIPQAVAMLRLDTDWYDSTLHELRHLYPLLSRHGVLIIDDYGHWQGARRAVDEYLATLPHPIFLHRIDYTGRIAIKPES